MTKLFNLDELFYIYRQSGIPRKNRKPGSIPYVSAKKINNGIDEYIDTSEYYENVIGLINDGNGGTGKCFYHPYKARFSNHVTVLKAIDYDIEEFYLYCMVQIENQTGNYSRAYALSNERTKNLKISLPIIQREDTHEIDIENIIKKIRKINISINKRHDISKVNYSYEKIDYTFINITDIFDLERGKISSIGNLKEGALPIITGNGSSDNNGIKRNIEIREGYQTYSNCYTITNNGTVGICFYHPYSFTCNSDVTVLIPKFDIELLSDLEKIMITALIENQTTKFNYSYKLGLNRLKMIKLHLPKNIKAKILT